MDYPGVKNLVPGPGEYEVSVNVKLDNPISLTVPATLSEYDVPFNPADT
jgi:hypothetical protein